MRSLTLPRRILVLGAVTVLLLATAGPVGARASVDRIEDFGSVVAVARPANFPIASISRVDCSHLVRVQLPDGSSTETMVCELSAAPVMVPEFQGVAPATAFVDVGTECLWASNYWFNTTGELTFAESYRLLVTPSGQVQARAVFPAEPLDCG